MIKVDSEATSVCGPIFVADRALPRLGMERALRDLILAIGSPTTVVLISGPEDNYESGLVNQIQLNSPPGWRGRLRALSKLRSVVRDSGRGTPIVAVGIWAFIPTAIATVFLRRQVILWEHSLLPWRLKRERRVTLAGICLRALAFRCRLVVSVSESSRKAVLSLVWPFSRAICIPNITPGEVLVMRDRGGPSDRVSLLGVGTLNYRKNWTLAIRAMAHLPTRFELVIAGDGPDRAVLSGLVEELGLQNRVELVGHVSNVGDRLANSDVLVHPSYAETFGYVLVEAAAFNVPVVCIDMPVMNEMVPGLVNGVISSADSTSFAQAIVRATERSQESFVAAQYERAQKLSDRAVIEAWNSVLGTHADIEENHGS